MDEENKYILVVEDEPMLRKALVDKLMQQGYNMPFTSLEEGVNDYVTQYLIRRCYF